MNKKVLNVVTVLVFIVIYAVVLAISGLIVAGSFWGAPSSDPFFFMTPFVKVVSIFLKIITLLFLLTLGWINKFQHKLVWKILVLSLCISIIYSSYEFTTNKTLDQSKPINSTQISDLGKIGTPQFESNNTYLAIVNVPLSVYSKNDLARLSDSVSGTWSQKLETTTIQGCAGLNVPTSILKFNPDKNSEFVYIKSLYFTSLRSDQANQNICTSNQVTKFLQGKPFYLLINGNVYQEYDTIFNSQPNNTNLKISNNLPVDVLSSHPQKDIVIKLLAQYKLEILVDEVVIEVEDRGETIDLITQKVFDKTYSTDIQRKYSLPKSAKYYQDLVEFDVPLIRGELAEAYDQSNKSFIKSTPQISAGQAYENTKNCAGFSRPGDITAQHMVYFRIGMPNPVLSWTLTNGSARSDIDSTSGKTLYCFNGLKN